MTEKTLLDRYIIEPATLEDSRQILDIYEEEAAPGNPALIFTRRDNAILSMQREGEQVVIFVCRNKFNNELIGFGAYSINSCFVNGTVCPVAYLFGLKCRKSYRNRAARAIPIIYNRIRLDLESKGIDNVLTTILSENLPARKFLTKSHRDMPRYTLLGKYEVFALCPLKQSRKKLPEGIVCEPAHITGRLRLENFLQTHGCKRNFFPVTNISSTLPDDFFEECMVLTDTNDGRILAAGYCWDQRSYKQLIVAGYSGIYKVLRHFSKPLRWCGYPPLPRIGSALNLRTLSFFIVREEKNEYFNWFVDAVMSKYNNCDIILIGAGPRYPHRSELVNRPHWTYTSDVFSVDWKKQAETVLTSEINAPTYLQCGRL